MERLHAVLLVLLVPPQRPVVWLVSLPGIAGVCPTSAVTNQGHAVTEQSIKCSLDRASVPRTYVAALSYKPGLEAIDSDDAASCRDL